MSTTNPIKREFEHWALGYQYDITHDKEVEDMYLEIPTQRAWVVWQSAAHLYRRLNDA